MQNHPLSPHPGGGVKIVTLKWGWGDSRVKSFSGWLRVGWGGVKKYHPQSGVGWCHFLEWSILDASLIPERAYSGIEIQHFLAYFIFWTALIHLRAYHITCLLVCPFFILGNFSSSGFSSPDWISWIEFSSGCWACWPYLSLANAIFSRRKIAFPKHVNFISASTENGFNRILCEKNSMSWTSKNIWSEEFKKSNLITYKHISL